MILKNKYILLLFYYSFPLFILVQYFVARGWIVDSYTITIAKIALLIVGGASVSTIKQKNYGFLFFSIFILYTILSGIAYFYSNRPFICYYEALTNYVQPMLMFYVGLNSNIDHGKFVKLLSLSFGFTLLLTIPAYITLTPWYVDFIKKSFSESSMSMDYIMSALRFAGPFADSYYVMYICMPVLSYYLNEVIIKENHKWIYYVIIAIYVISLILCQQRSAMLFTFIAFPYFIFFSKKKVKNFRYFFFIVIVLYIIMVINASSRMEDIWALLTDRVEKMSFSEAFGERKEKVFLVFTEWNNVLFGDGVGVYSHEAFRNGFVSVNDNGWIKLLVENGIIGVLLFVWLAISTLLRALKYKSYYYSEIFIILFFLFAMIGSDSLSMNNVLTLLFWLSVGRVWALNQSTLNIS